MTMAEMWLFDVRIIHYIVVLLIAIFQVWWWGGGGAGRNHSPTLIIKYVGGRNFFRIILKDK